jgi:hypothetical protein
MRRAPVPGHFKCVSTGEPRAPAVGTMLLVSALWPATNGHWAEPGLVSRARTGRAGFGVDVIARHQGRA